MPYGIFLVEDHPIMREAYQQLLEIEPDLELRGVSETAEGCLDVLDGVACDLVVTDLSLPGMDGIELVREIQKRRPGLATVVISAHEEPSYRERAEEAGALAYLVKRDLTTQLSSTIHRVMTAAPEGPPPGDAS